MDSVRPDACRSGGVGRLFQTAFAIHGLGGADLERLGDRLRLRAPGGAGADRANAVAQLAGSGCNLVPSEAAALQKSPQGVAAAAPRLRIGAAGVTYRFPRGVAIWASRTSLGAPENFA